MLDQVLEVFEIQLDFDLDIMKHGQTLSDITMRILEKLDMLLKQERPDLLLVYGDTTTTFASSFAAFYNHIAIGHVETGLRRYNKNSPYLEEMNRQMTGVLADLNFASIDISKQNLLSEGKKEEQIFVTGNTAIDALKTTIKSNYYHPLLKKIEGKRMILLTAHRREN